METFLVGFTTPPDETGTITFGGEWTVTGGSGRFKNAAGCGTYAGSGDAPTGVGDITFVGEVSQPNGLKLKTDD